VRNILTYLLLALPAVKVTEVETYLFKSVLISLLLHVHTYLYIMSVYHYSMDYMDPSPWSWLVTFTAGDFIELILLVKLNLNQLVNIIECRNVVTSLYKSFH
jgi:hypothetical protein